LASEKNNNIAGRHSYQLLHSNSFARVLGTDYEGQILFVFPEDVGGCICRAININEYFEIWRPALNTKKIFRPLANHGSLVIGADANGNSR